MAHSYAFNLRNYDPHTSDEKRPHGCEFNLSFTDRDRWHLWHVTLRGRAGSIVILEHLADAPGGLPERQVFGPQWESVRRTLAQAAQNITDACEAAKQEQEEKERARAAELEARRSAVFAEFTPPGVERRIADDPAPRWRPAPPTVDKGDPVTQSPNRLLEID